MGAAHSVWEVDHLYAFFVQWSPDVYGKDAKEQGFVVVEKEELNMIDNFFSEPTTKSWEIITVEEAKRRKSTCSYYEDEDEEVLPVLRPHSALLENMHIEQLARRLPARVQGYPWRLAYSTLEHGTSLKTLYRKSASLDSPVLLVIKDMDNQIFGAYATHPFKFSDHYYGTGETFLYTFSPHFKVFKWSGENSYFINGDISSLELGGGGGRFGLWLDADLYHGRSNSCSTFNNDILSKKEDFIVQDLEVWAFEMPCVFISIIFITKMYSYYLPWKRLVSFRKIESAQHLKGIYEVFFKKKKTFIYYLMCWCEISGMSHDITFTIYTVCNHMLLIKWKKTKWSFCIYFTLT
uniref:Uncharacterized protein DKFZp469H086 n=1 Tax=Pongo abelii TaxID=9601 RepID=Q5R8N5_PONAB|nr:hypothetical protein [Pongo abelii]